MASTDLANGESGVFVTRGIFDLAKTASVTWVQGAKLYWDNSAKSVTNVSTSNTFIGCAMTAAANADATCRIRLNGVSV